MASVARVGAAVKRRGVAEPAIAGKGTLFNTASLKPSDGEPGPAHGRLSTHQPVGGALLQQILQERCLGVSFRRPLGRGHGRCIVGGRQRLPRAVHSW